MSFDQYARKWDNEGHIQRATEIAKEIEHRLSQNHYKSALEFGCGTALVGFNLKHKFDQLLLVDSSEGMIQIANEKIAATASENLKAIHMDIVDTPLNEKFNVVYSSMVLHHIGNIEAVLGVFYELLEEGGELCIVDIDEEDGSFHDNFPDFKGHNGFNHQDLIRKIKKVGFKETKIESFYFGEKIDKGESVPYSLFILNAAK